MNKNTKKSNELHKVKGSSSKIYMQRTDQHYLNAPRQTLDTNTAFKTQLNHSITYKLQLKGFRFIESQNVFAWKGPLKAI